MSCIRRPIGVGSGNALVTVNVHEWRVANYAEIQGIPAPTFYCVWCRKIETR